ncbi:MAG: SpoIIE family protein phosphatase [Bacteroidales bacterium]|nr:SpoIIE family protein phosphatase [Bacteroidales bacterium]
MSNRVSFISRSISRKLSRKIVLLTLLIFVLAMIAVAVVSLIAIHNESIGNARGALRNTSLDIESLLVNVESAGRVTTRSIIHFNSEGSDISHVTEDAVLSDKTISGCAMAFEPHKSAHSDREYYMVASYISEGEDVARTVNLGGTDYDYLTMDWYQIPKLLDKPYWSEPYFDVITSQTVTTYSIPVYDDGDELVGILKFDIALTWLTDMISSLQPYPSSYNILIGRNGSFISHIQREKILNETIFSEPLAEGNEKALGMAMEIMSQQDGLLHFTFKGKGYYQIFEKLRNGWTAVIVCPQSEVYSDARMINITLAIVALLGIILMYLGCKKIISRSTMPLTEFTNAALTMAKGNFNATIPDVDSQDEIRYLHDSLCYLQSSINTYIKELKASLVSNEKFENELNIASAIQRNMLPREFPKTSDFDLYAALFPAKEVGGDLYDFYVKGDHLYFAIGDVSGKGVPAALFMAITRSAYRFISGMGMNMEQVERNINNAFTEGNESGMFVTMFIGCLDLKTLELEYCNAGHNPIVVVSPSGKADFLHAKANLAAGLIGGFQYQGETLQLEKGSRLILYTDGISEAENRQKELFGEDRLLEYSASVPVTTSAKDFTDGLLDAVRGFTDGNEQNDDITVLTIRV